jgi:lysine-ketoglutarate reductase/saccharopine dehydrogenase-like protein (TIGR00300 family)
MATETIRLRGHIIDSLLLPRVLDEIIAHGGEFEILDIDIGRRREDTSDTHIRIEVAAQEQLEGILQKIQRHGAERLEEGDVRLEPAPADGVFPEGFYVTSNQPTQIRWAGQWLEVHPHRMDSAIVVEPAGRTATIRRFSQVRRGDKVVVGNQNVRVLPVGRAVNGGKTETFEFMSSSVSSEKSKSVVIRTIADELRAVKANRKRVLMVAGPALVHTGAGRHLIRLMEHGYVDLLFAGNALAVHDIESAFFGTSLGIDLKGGVPVEHGHQNHIHAINRIRALGGIRAAVEKGQLTSGIMHDCIRLGIDFVLAGSIRDDGPLPEVITDTVEAQGAMAGKMEGNSPSAETWNHRAGTIGLALMIATMLHSIAVGNLLPAATKTVCVDINPSVVTKLVDRGSFQAIGLVTDVEPFFNELLGYLDES